MSETGRETAAILTTMVGNAEANSLYPDEYIAKILTNISGSMVDAAKFMPWNTWMREDIEIETK